VADKAKDANAKDNFFLDRGLLKKIVARKRKPKHGCAPSSRNAAQKRFKRGKGPWGYTRRQCKKNKANEGTLKTLGLLYKISLGTVATLPLQLAVPVWQAWVAQSWVPPWISWKGKGAGRAVSALGERRRLSLLFSKPSGWG
jgi:hypothetical protein